VVGTGQKDTLIPEEFTHTEGSMDTNLKIARVVCVMAVNLLPVFNRDGTLTSSREVR
jgi:hypothetical protein